MNMLVVIVSGKERMGEPGVPTVRMLDKRSHMVYILTYILK